MIEMSREEAIECIEAIHVQMFNSGNSKWTKACDMAIEALKTRPHGEWIPVIGCDGRTIAYKCKTCGWFKPHDIMPFCENCGSDNRKSGERND